MSRDDLIGINAKIVKTVAEAIKQHAPNAFVIVVSNPLDAMVTLMKRLTGFPKARVVGMAGVLDSARYRRFLAWELGVSVTSVQALVLGGHGDDMVPIRSHTTVNGIPVASLIAAERLDAIEKRVRQAGAEVDQPAEDRLRLLLARVVRAPHGGGVPAGSQVRAAGGGLSRR